MNKLTEVRLFFRAVAVVGAVPWIQAGLLAMFAALPVSARADSGSFEKLRLSEHMEHYFAAEKAGGLVFVASAITYLGTGAYLVTNDGDRARGASYPLFATGGLQLLVGVLVAATAKGQVEDRKSRIAADPERFRSEELARMRGVMNRFSWLLGIELGAAAAGVGLSIYGERKDKDVLAGAGLGLATGSAMLFCLEVLARQRGASYVSALRSSVDVSLSPQGAVAGFRGRF
ncbi:MAG: hypothetical protein QM778_07290 [Myxococcales bacterium]